MIAVLMGLLAYSAASLLIAVPYLFGALAGLWSERAGVVHIGLEGMLLIGAFAATLGAAAGGTKLGIVSALVAGVVMSMIFAAIVVYGRADPIVVGVALNLFADGATRFFLRAIYDSSSNSPRIDRWASGPLVDHVHPLFLVGVLLVGATHWVLQNTAFGLRVRAAGEAPAALRAAAVSVPRTQFLALLCAGPIAALGGVFLAWNSRAFGASMTNGRGFLALAVLVIGRRRPLGVLLAAIGLGMAGALELTPLARVFAIPPWAMQAVPYVATLLVLALRRRPQAQPI